MIKKNNFDKNIIFDSLKIKDVIQILQKLPYKFCLVINNNKQFIGTVTDGDIRRGLLKDYNLKDKVEKIYNKKAFYTKKKISQIQFDNLLNIKKIAFFPLLDKKNRIKKVYMSSEHKEVKILDNYLLIMAGGKGKRLRPFTKKIPKPLLPVDGKPIIEKIIISAKKQGIINVIVSVNYLANKIKNYLSDGSHLGVKIDYIKENKPLGTAGSIFYFNQFKKPLIVSNADIISNINYSEMLKYHKRYNSYITIGAISNYEKSDYGNIFFKNNKVIKIEEKKEKKVFINTGIYILSPKVQNFFIKKKYCDMTDLIHDGIKRKKKIVIFPFHENWFDLGLKEKYLKHKKKKYA